MSGFLQVSQMVYPRVPGLSVLFFRGPEMLATSLAVSINTNTNSTRFRWLMKECKGLFLFFNQIIQARTTRKPTGSKRRYCEMSDCDERSFNPSWMLPKKNCHAIIKKAK